MTGCLTPTDCRYGCRCIRHHGHDGDHECTHIGPPRRTA